MRAVHVHAALLLAVLAGIALPAAAQVFKCQQPSGLVTYGDKPCNVVRAAPVLDVSQEAQDRAKAREVFAEPQRSARARAEASSSGNVPKTTTAAAPSPASTQLRALGPSQALDKSGTVYQRVGGGYVDTRGNFVAGTAVGHR